MKKREFLLVFLFLVCLFALIGCKTPTHTHTPGEWITDTAATCTAAGSRHRVCIECGETAETGVIPETGHAYATTWASEENIHYFPCLNIGCQAVSEMFDHSPNEEGACIVCGYVTTVSRDLSYHLNDAETGYMLIGPGSCEDTHIVVPAIYNGLPVTYVFDNAFSFVSGITDITLPYTVIGIGNDAFQECADLENVTLPAGLTTIGQYAFYNTALESVHIPAGVVAIQTCAFANCDALTTLTFAEGSQLKVIGDLSFIRCKKLESIAFPAELTDIGSAAFKECATLERLDFTASDQLTTIGDYAFSGCSNLKKVSFGLESWLARLGCEAFADCKSLTSIGTVGSDADFTMPFSVTTIDRYAFSNCVGLQIIELTNNVTDIGGYAFSGCTALQYIELPATLTVISDNLFFECGNLKSIHIPAGVTEIGKFAFYKCDKLESVVFAEDAQLTTLKNGAFHRCAALGSIVIPAGVTSMESQAFAYCDALRSVTFMDTGTWHAEIFTMEPTDLADPQKAAEILYQYCNFNWVKS